MTRTKSIYIHKSIASKVKKAFNKIYHGKEKFPIHDVGGFDWRGSNKSLHSLGLAVDINANENYMVDHGKVLAGSFWKPGKNPYSIKKNSDVKKYMKTIGFKQCICGFCRIGNCSGYTGMEDAGSERMYCSVDGSGTCCMSA